VYVYVCTCLRVNVCTCVRVYHLFTCVRVCACVRACVPRQIAALTDGAKVRAFFDERYPQFSDIIRGEDCEAFARRPVQRWVVMCVCVCVLIGVQRVITRRLVCICGCMFLGICFDKIGAAEAGECPVAA
jgi:hypothetical protein